MRDGGKGDTPRPLGVPMEVFDANFEAIFGKKKKATLEEVDEGIFIVEIKNKKDEDANSGQQSSSI